MAIYYWTLLSALLLGTINDLHRKPLSTIKDTYPLNISAFFFLLIIAGVSALRLNVGADYDQYVWNFETWYVDKPLTMEDWSTEPGIILLAKFFNLFCHDSYLFVSFLAVITITVFIVSINKVSPNSTFSFCLFILLGIWTGTFNGIRQYLAAAIIFTAYGFIVERNLGKWLLTICIASLFHTSAIIMLPIYFVARRKADLKQVGLLAVFAVAMLGASDILWGVVETVKGDSDAADSVYGSHGINIFRTLTTWVPVVLFILNRKACASFTARENVLVNLSIVNAALMTMASGSAYLARVGIYTNTFNCLAIPMIISMINPRSRNIVTVCVFIFYFVFWMFQLRASVALEYHSLFELWNRW